jgi:hypothetical protein
VDREAGSRRDEASRFLAEQWGLEFREAHTLSIDPAALKVIAAADARRLAAFPLALEHGRPIFAIAEPTAERLAAVRETTSEEASFVIVNPSTLDALLSSKIFNASSSRDGAKTTAPAAQVATPSAPAAAAAPAQPAEPPPPPEVEQTEAAPAPPERRVEPPAPATRPPTPPPPSLSLDLTDSSGGVQIERRPVRPVLVAVGAKPGGDHPSQRLGALLNQITTGASHLASQADELALVLEDNERELRIAHAELEQARLENDKTQAELDSLRNELSQSQTLNEAVTHRLRELVNALEAAQPSGGWEADATAAALEASTRIA